MRQARLQSWRRHQAVAIVLGMMALAASGAVAAAAGEVDAHGLRPVVGELEACITPGNVGSVTPYNPLSALALASGDLLLVRWGGAGWGLLRLSRDGRTLRRVEADVPTGLVAGAVRLANDRLLVTAEEGIFLFDGDRRLKRIANCDQTGVAQFFVRSDGGVLTFADGSPLLAGQRGLLRMSPEGRLERLGEVPDGASAFEIVGGYAVLVSGVFGHYLITHDGRTVPVATGTRGQSFIAVRGAKSEMRSAPSKDESLARSFGKSAPPRRGIALMDTSGRMTWAMPPEDVTMSSHPIELGDGRILWLTDRGLLRLRGDGTMQQVSAAVRLACGDASADDLPLLQAMVDGRTLVHAGGLLFTIDRKDRVLPIVKQSSCVRSLREDDFAATNDGSVYVVEKDALHRVNAGGRAMAIIAVGETGTIYSVKSYGDDVLVKAKEGLFHTRRGKSLDRVVPKGHDADLLYNNDLDGRPLICVDKSALHRLDQKGVLRPLRAVAGIRCWGVDPAGSLGLLMRRDETTHLLITRDDQAIAIPGARVWPVAQLHDGTAILMTLPAGRHEMGATLDRDEESTLPHSLIRVSPTGHVDSVAFDAPEIELKPLRDPTWQERSQVRAIQFSSPTRGWAILGQRGILSATVDAGAQWSGVTANGGPIEGLASLSFTADGRHGIAAGKQALWRTDDAGTTWMKMPWQREISDVHLLRLLGREGARVYVVAERATKEQIIAELLLSQDGGRTWAAQDLPLPGPLRWWRSEFSGIEFDSSGRNGWLVGANRLLTTGDGGTTWQLFTDLRDYREIEERRWRFELPKLNMMFGSVVGAYLPPAPVAIAYWAPGEVWCVARWKLFCVPPQDELAKSGVKEIETEPDVVVVALAVDSDSKHGWAVGTQGLILATEDGGRTWGVQPSGVHGTVAGVFFLSDALHGWVWGEDGILLTRNGGKSWQPTRGR